MAVSFHRKTYWSDPYGSIRSVYSPVDGSVALRHDRSACPTQPPGTSVSVGWSKLCQTIADELPPLRPCRTKFPVSRSTAATAAAVSSSREPVELDDQIDSLDPFPSPPVRRAKLPSWARVSSADDRSATGESLFITQTTLELPAGEKKPSSNVPPADTSVRFPVRDSPAESVSLAAADELGH
ncbi:hypothetical protein U9M48_006900 [Paspalum notatum var. saurae]|uniref:Uncharacterized protein n=1 Tax=Paspalum notatum var. saurae TaxID=547442 RepID=A0AAQ3PQI8_PASNO